jgi:hypothetical protein
MSNLKIISHQSSSRTILLFAFALITNWATAQTNLKGHITPNGFFDQLYDHYGEIHELQDLYVQGYDLNQLITDSKACEAGYFVLHFEDGSGFEGTNSLNIARRGTACQVFSDISSLISSRLGATHERVHIWVRDIDNTSLTSPTSNENRVYGSSYYIVPEIANSNFGGIVDGALYQSIQSGRSAYTGLTALLKPENVFFHGFLAVNFSNTAFTWNTDISNANAPAGEIDLYTEVLHQALHMLGFTSLIDVDGSSVFGANKNYYSRYDHFLKNNSGTPLIMPDDVNCPNYDINFMLNSSILSPNCDSTTISDFTECNNAIFFGQNIPVYTPGCFETAMSLSHLEDQCFPTDTVYGNNLYFLMSNVNGTGSTGTKRWPRNEEHEILCELGYSVAGSYGPQSSTYYHEYASACAGASIASVHKGISAEGEYVWIGDVGEETNISNFLDGSMNVDSYSCLELLYGNGTITQQGNTFNYEPSAEGLHLFRYTPSSNSQQIGGITYLFLAARGNCPPFECNLINNGGFEQNFLPCNNIIINNQTIMCWSQYTSTPELYGRFCPNIDLAIPTSANMTSAPADSWNGIGNDHFLGLWGRFDGISTDEESMQTQLTEPLIVGETYTISFYGLVSDGLWFANIPAHISFRFAPTYPVPSNWNNYDVSVASMLGETMIVPANNNNTWQYMTQTFIYNGPPGMSNFMVGYDASLFVHPQARYVFIDDLTITKGILLELSLPQSLCTSILEDLEQYASIPGGDFEGVGVISNNLGGFDFVAPGAGDFLITYTYTDAFDCEFIVTDVITVIIPDCFAPGDVIINATTTWSNVNFTFCGNVIVQPGFDLFVVDNSALHFLEGFGIILMDNANLYVDESLLTVAEGCGDFWRGIYCENPAGFGQGMNNSIFITKSSIYYAEKAIEARTIFSFSPTLGAYWASVNMVDSYFYNNKQDLNCVGHIHEQALMVRVRAEGTVFHTDQYFPQGYLPEQSKALLHDVRPATFNKCKFINDEGAFLSQIELRAISAQRCFLTYESSPVQTQNSQSVISGFVRGIHVMNVYGGIEGTYRVVATEFYCHRSMYFRDARTTIAHNRIFNLPQSVYAGTGGSMIVNNSQWENVAPESPLFDYSTSPYGLYIDGQASGYLVDYNWFATSQFPNLILFSHGIIVNNSGQGDNVVRRNNFTSMERALKYQGNNRNQLLSQGSTYFCNQFFNNSADIRETQSPITAANTWGVPHQGTPLIDFNNSFTQTAPLDDILNSVTPHRYYRTQQNNLANNPWTQGVNASVILLLANFPFECQEISGFAPETTEYEECFNDKSASETSYNATHNIYQSLVDGGDTDELLNAVISTGYGNALETYYELMAKSPALSEKVMLEAIAQYNLPNVLLAEILASNPSAAKSDEIIDAVENRMTPFDEYQKAMLLQGLTAISDKEVLEGEMSTHLTKRSLAQHCIIMGIFSDSLVVDKYAAILPLFDETEHLGDAYQKINMLCHLGQYAAAIDIAENAPYYFRLKHQDITDLEVLAEILEIESMLYQNDSLPLTGSQIQLLDDALYTTSAVAAERALNLLIKYADYEYFEPMVDDEFAEPRSNFQAPLRYAVNDLQIFPNPAGNMATVHYHAGGFAFVELMDLHGKIIQTLNVQNTQKQFALNLNNVAPGLYLVRILDQNSRAIAQTKLVKQ